MQFTFSFAPRNTQILSISYTTATQATFSGPKIMKLRHEWFQINLKQN